MSSKPYKLGLFLHKRTS